MGEREYRLRDEALMSVQSGDELVALDMRRSVYLAANESGRQLWELLAAQGATETALTALLQERYKLDSRTAVRDVSAFLKELQAAGLLVDTDASGG
jgi:Coenzyme PQQ synthesis protein D (PqqD)